MQREDVRKGLLLKVVTDYSNVPAGTWAIVDSTGAMHMAYGGLPSGGDRIHRFRINFHVK
jgi:hypothetical protein